MNNKGESLALLGIFLVAMLLVSITIASAKSENSGSGNSGSSGSGGGSSGSSNSGSSGNQGKSIGASTNSGNSDKGNGNSGNSGKGSENGNSVNSNSESKKISGGIQSGLEIEEEDGELKVKFSNGNKKNLDVDPDLAISIAFDALGSDTFNITLNQSGELVEYEAVAFKNGKFLWLFNSEVKIKASIDPESGNISIDKPWWAFLVAGENKDQSNSTKVVVCHIPPGNPANEHTISIGSPALKAHLKHGDSIGACGETGTPGNGTTNETNQTNQTTSNLTITLTEPLNGSAYNSTIIPLQFVYTNDSFVECFYILDSENETLISECMNTSFNTTTAGNHSIYVRINEGNLSAFSNTNWFSISNLIIDETNSTNNDSNNNTL